ncbi:MAG TPA: EAL domain-containing protein [Mycobacteriales bacterium]|nr:EAL domain-containing protein [Mycobacteriales bacterium]
MEARRQLSDVLSEFARTLVTDFPIQAILDHLVARIVEILPISAAGVTLISPGADPRYVAASDDSALRFERLQTELGEGPCLAAYGSGEAVAVPDLNEDDRFPVFASRALEEGLVAVFTFPLRHGDQPLGALDLYRTSAGSLTAEEMAAAQTLADVATAYLLNARARNDLREASERAKQSSLHDALTGLPNRALLLQRLDHAILRGRRSEKTLAVLFADLDKFKLINDAYGHHVGDELLIAVAERLTGLLRPGDTLARLAGDEFVILCEDLDGPAQVEPLAARIDRALARSFVLSGIQVQVSASVGIAFSDRDDDFPERVLQDADMAMYQVKRKGGACHATIDLRDDRAANERASLRHDLHGALARGELRTEYRPIVATAAGRIIGVEALLRWHHPVLGILPPETVVPLAERSGLIAEIGRWVLDRACRDRSRWQGRDPQKLGIWVNVSAHQLMAPGLAAAISTLLADTRTEPGLVTLEVTESVFIQDSARALVVLDQLKRLGLRLALDDFGAGYSSLGYLRKFPFDVVKIDRSITADLDRDPTTRLMVTAIVGLAHGLDMTIVAAGVETSSQYQTILALGCDAYQGFHFSQPRSAAGLAPLMSDQTDGPRQIYPDSEQLLAPGRMLYT